MQTVHLGWSRTAGSRWHIGAQVSVQSNLAELVRKAEQPQDGGSAVRLRPGDGLGMHRCTGSLRTLAVSSIQCDPFHTAGWWGRGLSVSATPGQGLSRCQPGQGPEPEHKHWAGEGWVQR